MIELTDFRKAGEHECAEDRPEQRADAADDRTENHLDRAADVEDLFGKQIVVEERIEHTGERGHRRRDHQGVHLIAERVDAGGARGLLVLADCEPEIADAAACSSARDSKNASAVAASMT